LGAPWPSSLACLKNLAGFSGALSSGQRYAKLIWKRTTLLLRRLLEFAKEFPENYQPIFWHGKNIIGSTALAVPFLHSFLTRRFGS